MNFLDTPTAAMAPQPHPFRRVLIANRGEIAVRILRTLRNLGISGAVICTAEDADAMHVREADIAVQLPLDSAGYLDMAAVVAAARSVDADAVHPGYGFLSENADFARACAEAGLVFVGPPPAATAAMGDKISAKSAAVAEGVPIVPGRFEPGLTDFQIAEAIEQVGTPALLKPSAGGGGKGMRLIEDGSNVTAEIAAARREAATAFGDDTLMVERYVASPRHVEVQVLADQHGVVVALADRECSLQRRHQKVIEEAPALLPEPVRAQMQADAVRLAASVGYVGVGTVEFVVDASNPEDYFFLEMNTRLQVEHTVTEEIFGIDLVAAQLHVAAGRPVPEELTTAQPFGHAIQARLYAEDPTRGYLPTGGELLWFDPAPGVRVDVGVQTGERIGSGFDPLLAKIVVHGLDRADAIGRLSNALAGTSVLGVVTNQALLLALANHDDYRQGHIDTTWLDRHNEVARTVPMPTEVLALAGLDRLRSVSASGDDPWERTDSWRLGAAASAGWRVSRDHQAWELRVTGTAQWAQIRSWEIGQPEPEQTTEMKATWTDLAEGVRRARAHLGERSVDVVVASTPDEAWIGTGGLVWHLREAPRLSAERGMRSAQQHTTARAPMPGTVLAVLVEEGQQVSEGDPLVTVEAMKMEHTVTAGTVGTVSSVRVGRGDRVSLDQELVELKAGEDESR